MFTIYLILGLIWTTFAFSKRKQLKVSQQDHWFSFVLFSFLLWPFFAYFAYERGILVWK
jgi:hypothetical protein